jgi:hypothetical protein
MHSWRKLMPPPFHPKRDLAAQNAFKKTALPVLSKKSYPYVLVMQSAKDRDCSDVADPLDRSPQ